jgi:PIN domain nuclease of toxin-antitoxin system
MLIVKYQLGKLPLPESPEIYLPKQRDRHQIANLDLDEDSVTQLASLPQLHKYPFDRMLICQALKHNLTIATVDSEIIKYPIALI